MCWRVHPSDSKRFPSAAAKEYKNNLLLATNIYCYLERLKTNQISFILFYLFLIATHVLIETHKLL